MTLADPRLAKRFRFVRRAYDAGVATLVYAFDDGPELVDPLAQPCHSVVDRHTERLGVTPPARRRQRDTQRRHVLQRLIVQLTGPALPLAL